MNYPIALLVLLSVCPLQARADTIFFKNGGRLDVGDTWQEGGQVKCLLYGEEAAYPLRDVLRVEKSRPPAPEPAGPGGAAGDAEALALHNRAVELAGAGKLREALLQEQQALRLAPGNTAIRQTLGAIYNGLGVERRAAGDLDGALQQLKAALDYAPDEVQLKKNLAVVYVDKAQQALQKSEYRQGRELLDQALRLDPQNAHGYALSGKIAYLENNYGQAEQDWSRALQLDPRLQEVRQQLARLRQEKAVVERFEIRERDNFSITFAGGAQNRDLADALMQVLRDAYREVGRDLNLYPDFTVPVIVYPQAELGALDYFPDWAAGAYDGKIRFGENLWKKDLSMRAVLYHEYTHVLVRMAAGHNAPFWLNEGLAEHEARAFKSPAMISRRQKLLYGAGRLFTLDELAALNVAALSGLPPQAIELAYAQSEDFVRFLLEKYTLRDLQGLLGRLGRGEGLQAAVRAELNDELSALEQAWRGRRRAP